MKRLVLAAVLLIALGAPVQAQTPEAAPDFNEGFAAYESGDYATALRVMTVRAALGDATAQFNLGIMYENSEGVPQDYAEAVKWYRKAAEQGYVAAQYNLSLMYAKGLGVPQDDAEAVK